MLDFADEIDFSVCILDKNSLPAWRKILKKFKKDLKESYEKTYAVGIYQVLPQPPSEESSFFLSDNIGDNLRKIL